jgi:hypothetical protein
MEQKGDLAAHVVARKGLGERCGDCHDDCSEHGCEARELHSANAAEGRKGDLLVSHAAGLAERG